MPYALKVSATTTLSKHAQPQPQPQPRRSWKWYLILGSMSAPLSASGPFSVSPSLPRASCISAIVNRRPSTAHSLPCNHRPPHTAPRDAGTEAGGHTGDVSTMVLVPQCVDMCAGHTSPLHGGPVVVVGAGGIFDGQLRLKSQSIKANLKY